METDLGLQIYLAQQQYMRGHHMVTEVVPSWLRSDIHWQPFCAVVLCDYTAIRVKPMHTNAQAIFILMN